MSIRTLSLVALSVALVMSTTFAGDNSKEGQAQEMLALAKAKKAEGAFLGIVPAEVTSDIAADYGVQTGQGVVVEETVSGSPAEEAGLRTNDVLLAINGVKLTGPSELRVQLDKFKKGDEVSLTYIRGGKERTASVTLESRDRDIFDWSWNEDDALRRERELATPMPPNAPHAPHAMRWMEGGRTMAFAGIVTQELSDGLKSYFKVEGGALISEVVEDSPAEKAGLKAGDIIVKIGSDEVEDQGDVTEAIREADPDQTVDFHIMRDGKSMVIPVTLTNRKDFYGEAGDGEYYYGFGEAEAEQLAEEMEKLQEEMNRVGIELENLPDLEWKMQIDTGTPRVIIGGDARAISTENKGWWNMSFRDLRERMRSGMEEIKKDLQVLKQELKELQIEVRQRMSQIWGPQIDLTPQA